MIWSRRSAPLVLTVGVLLLGACGDDGTNDGSETATAMDCDDLPQLHVVNATGNAVDEIIMLACDMTDQSSFPVPPGGLPDGGELTINLPGPGCWVLQYNGEGCFTEMPGMVDAVSCETVEWMLTPEHHACAGG